MVRIIVGTLIDIGRGKITMPMSEIIAGKNRNNFKKDTYIVFYNALNVAYSMNEDNSKVEVEEAYKNLLVAFNNLEEIK